jgi:hypothetical protein
VTLGAVALPLISSLGQRRIVRHGDACWPCASSMSAKVSSPTTTTAASWASRVATRGWFTGLG